MCVCGMANDANWGYIIDESSSPSWPDGDPSQRITQRMRTRSTRYRAKPAR